MYLLPAADGPPGVFHPDRPDLQAARNALGRNYASQGMRGGASPASLAVGARGRARRRRPQCLAPGLAPTQPPGCAGHWRLPRAWFLLQVLPRRTLTAADRPHHGASTSGVISVSKVQAGRCS